MAKTWRCGDCGCEWDKSVYYCLHTYSDYLAVHGGSVEAAINLAVERAIAPLVREAEARLETVKHYRAPSRYKTGTPVNTYFWKWKA